MRANGPRTIDSKTFVCIVAFGPAFAEGLSNDEYLTSYQKGEAMAEENKHQMTPESQASDESLTDDALEQVSGGGGAGGGDDKIVISQLKDGDSSSSTSSPTSYQYDAVGNRLSTTD